MNIKRAALSLGGAAIVALGGASLLYSREIRTIRDRLSAGSEVVQTQHGPIEYTTWGDGVGGPRRGRRVRSGHSPTCSMP